MISKIDINIKMKVVPLKDLSDSEIEEKIRQDLDKMIELFNNSSFNYEIGEIFIQPHIWLIPKDVNLVVGK